MVDRSRAYTVIGIISAAVAALLTAPYTAVDASVLLFAALMVIQYCLRKVELPLWLRLSKPEVRSRVFRYAEIAKRGKGDAPRNWIVNDRLAVFSATELLNLPREELLKLEAELQAAG
jgi:hypothetical protein